MKPIQTPLSSRWARMSIVCFLRANVRIKVVKIIKIKQLHGWEEPEQLKISCSAARHASPGSAPGSLRHSVRQLRCCRADFSDRTGGREEEEKKKKSEWGSGGGECDNCWMRTRVCAARLHTCLWGGLGSSTCPSPSPSPRPGAVFFWEGGRRSFIYQAAEAHTHLYTHTH